MTSVRGAYLRKCFNRYGSYGMKPPVCSDVRRSYELSAAPRKTNGVRKRSMDSCQESAYNASFNSLHVLTRMSLTHEIVASSAPRKSEIFGHTGYHVRMRLSLLLALLLAACSSVQTEKPAVLKGQLVLEVDPNPIVATRVSENTWEFPFDIVMREAGGVDLHIESFTIDVYVLGAIHVFSAPYEGSMITQKGYPDRIEAGQFHRFPFRIRRDVPNDILFKGAYADVTAQTLDAMGNRNETKLRVGVRAAK